MVDVFNCPKCGGKSDLNVDPVCPHCKGKGIKPVTKPKVKVEGRGR